MAVIRKAVFPLGGLGTRFLPATKACAKEMLPIVDKPLIQYAVEEAVRVGITEMIFVTNASKYSVENHFDRHYEWEDKLRVDGKAHLLALVEAICPAGIEFIHIRQPYPSGLGQAVLCAESLIGNEPFAVLLADVLINDANTPCLGALVESFRQTAHSVLTVIPVKKECVNQYGIVEISNTQHDVALIQSMVEKPNIEEAPSNLAALGRYVFTPAIFSCLKQTQPDGRGEIQLTDAIQLLLSKEKVAAHQFHGQHYDCGSKLGFLQATFELGMNHPEVGQDFCNYLKTFFSSEA